MLVDENTEKKKTPNTETHSCKPPCSFHRHKMTNGEELRNTEASGTSQEHIDFQ